MDYSIYSNSKYENCEKQICIVLKKTLTLINDVLYEIIGKQGKWFRWNPFLLLPCRGESVGGKQSHNTYENRLLIGLTPSSQWQIVTRAHRSRTCHCEPHRSVAISWQQRWDCRVGQEPSSQWQIDMVVLPGISILCPEISKFECQRDFVSKSEKLRY